MKAITMYKCDLCDFQTTDEHECLEHEASKHYKISIEDYDKWKELTKKAEHAGWEVSNFRNPTTLKAFDDAIDGLITFEQAHGLPGKRPQHF